LVGSGSQEFTAHQHHIEGLGFLESSDEEMATWAGAIVPLLTGGGTRIKIAEAFSKHCPLVATTLGAHGYDLKDGHQCFLRDEPNSFAEACLELLQNPKRGQALAERAYQEFQEKWDWKAISPTIAETAKQVLRCGDLKQYA
jgi:glycosyltransferase involved in cell wall biosynthesis